MKQARPDTIACINLNLRRATRVMNRIYDGYLSDCGLKVGQFSILHAVHLLESTTSKVLQELMVLDQTTLSRNLKPLIRDDLLLAVEGEDKRQRLLSLTAAGKKKHEEANKVWKKAQQHVKRELGEEQTELLLGLSRDVAKL